MSAEPHLRAEGEKLPIVWCIDVEPDEHLVDPRARLPWRGFERALEELPALRDRLSEATGAPARLSWFFRLDSQIEHVYGHAAWPLRHYHEAVRRLEGSGDEIGAHPHAYRWSRAGGHWVVDHGNAAWVAHCTEQSVDTLRTELGRPCRAFRFGAGWLSTHNLALVESLGVSCDLTLEPGFEERRLGFPDPLQTGSLPDTRQAPREVHRFRRGSARSADPLGREGLTIIPVTTGLAPPAYVGGRNRLRLWLRALTDRQSLQPVMTAADLWRGPEVLVPVVRQHLEAGARHLCVVVRSDCFGRSRCRARILAALDGLLELLRGRQAAFVTPQACADDANRAREIAEGRTGPATGERS